MEPIRILLVEDDPVWREGLIDFLQREPDLQVIAVASTQQEALKAYKDQPIDVVLMDINLTAHHLDGIDAAIEILQADPAARIIMLTSLSQREIIIDTFSVGALNYIQKGKFGEIPAAVRGAAQNRSAIHPTAAEILLSEFSRLKRDEQQRLLTPSEREILQLIHQGRSHSQIEKQLHIAGRTIKNHINHILKKLGVKTSKEAAEWADKRHLL